MSGPAWIAAFQDGNDGKWHCRPTLFHSHFFQAVTWAGWTGDGTPDGIDYAVDDARAFYKVCDDRPYYAVT